MSFLCDYSASSSSSEEEEETASAPPVPRTSSTAPTVAPVSAALPSADELFASDTSSALTSGRITATVSSNDKRRVDEADSRSDAADKRRKVGERGASAAEGPSSKAKLPFAPPQLKRPNVSTEDREAWNTARTFAQQRLVAQKQADLDQS